MGLAQWSLAAQDSHLAGIFVVLLLLGSLLVYVLFTRLLFYAVTNMVKDGLLDKVSHTKGFSCYEALATGKVEKYWYTDWTAWWKGGGKRNKKPVSA